MAKMVTGIRIDSITITREFDAGPGVKIEGTYAIMGEEGKIFAKQTFNMYSSVINLEISSDVAAAVRILSDQLKKEIETITGII